jgi:Tol biopolymer transport system component
VFVLRGDRIGASVLRTVPQDNGGNVSTRTPLAFTFAEPLDAASFAGKITVEPPLAGVTRVNGTNLIYTPSEPLRANTRYRVIIRSGGRSLRGRVMTQDHSITFTTRRPQLAYLAPSEAPSDLYLADPESGATQRITSEPFGVFHYAISPDGERIVASITRDDSGSADLWLMNIDGSARERLVTCTEEVCQSPAWSADGRRIAFERRKLIQRAIGKLPGPARIWLLDMTSRQTSPLFDDDQHIASLPRWSPVDERLLFYDQTDSALTIVDTFSQKSTQIPSTLGDPGSWSPDGASVIFPDILPLDDRGYSQMLRADLSAGIITTVFPISTHNDAAVAFSISGDQLAFSRQEAGLRSAIGPQIWLARPDGSRLRQLTFDRAFSHFRLAWSPDGRWISAQRFQLVEQYAKAEVYLAPVDGKPGTTLIKDAILPEWVP